MLTTALTAKVIPVVMAGFLMVTTPAFITKDYHKQDVKQEQTVGDLATKKTVVTREKTGWTTVTTDPVTGDKVRQYNDKITTTTEEEIIGTVKKFKQKVCDKVINIVNKVRG